MIKSIVNNLKENWIYFTIILLFLGFTGYFISSYSRSDGHILMNQYHAPFWDKAFYYITHIGDGLTAIIITICLFIWKEKYGYLALFSFLFTAAVTHGLKFFVFDDVKRPSIDLWNYFRYEGGHFVIPLDDMRKGNSFPSGHTTSAMSIFGILALISNKQWKWNGIILASLAILASFSRVYLSEHFTEDVFVGTIIGTFGTLLVYSILAPRYKDKFNKGISIKRTFDVLFSLVVIILGLPFFLIISLLVFLSGKGGIFFKQQRVGEHQKLFWLYKFRTMRPDTEKLGQITVGGRDPRVTKIGYFLRKLKLDEFPQLINILKGEMSVVGPRPEVPKYVHMYNEEQLKVLQVKPGLTDYASLEYIDENEILGNSSDPEKEYIENIMPAKLNLNLRYIRERSFFVDIKIIFRTFLGIFR